MLVLLATWKSVGGLRLAAGWTTHTQPRDRIPRLTPAPSSHFSRCSVHLHTAQVRWVGE